MAILPTGVARLRRVSSRALAVAGGAALQTSNKLASTNGALDLQGDRIIEWSFCLARLRNGPGTTLDFGADTAFISLAAAQRGRDVVALDRLPSALDYRHERVKHVQADILERPLADRRFDEIVNCSSVEHVGLEGRYASGNRADGDLEAMAILRDMLDPGGQMILTVPVGRDLVCAPYHRIYGSERLGRLLDGYSVAEAQFWHKDPSTALWTQTPDDVALSTEGSVAFYALGLFVLRGA